MPRLTNDIRGTIVNALMVHKFDSAVEALCVERADIARQVYEHHYKRDLKRMNDLPDGWLLTDGDVKFDASGTIRSYYFSGKMYGSNWSSRWQNEVCDFPSNSGRVAVEYRFRADEHNRTICTFDANHPIAEAVERHEAAGEALAEQIKAARAQATATVGRFTTTEKLIEAWPEIKPFIPEKAAPPPALPALPTQHLNSMFDLPVGDE